MPEIPSASQIAEKWARVTPTRTQDYLNGVAQPRRDWADSTVDARERYEQGIQEAIGRDAFSRGVERAGTEKWRSRTREKGPGRWSQGISISRGDYEAGFAPFRSVIQNTTLPPRGPAGSPSNIERARVMAQALHQAKLDQA